jgi:hypothetical protein
MASIAAGSAPSLSAAGLPSLGLVRNLRYSPYRHRMDPDFWFLSATGRV